MTGTGGTSTCTVAAADGLWPAAWATGAATAAAQIIRRVRERRIMVNSFIGKAIGKIRVLQVLRVLRVTL
jgi:hypothetical protein